MTTIRIADASIKDVARTIERMNLNEDLQETTIKTYNGMFYGRITTIKSQEYKNNLESCHHPWIRLAGNVFLQSSGLSYILRKAEEYFIVTL